MTFEAFNALNQGFAKSRRSTVAPANPLMVRKWKNSIRNAGMDFVNMPEFRCSCDFIWTSAKVKCNKLEDPEINQYLDLIGEYITSLDIKYRSEVYSIAFNIWKSDNPNAVASAVSIYRRVETLTDIRKANKNFIAADRYCPTTDYGQGNHGAISINTLNKKWNITPACKRVRDIALQYNTISDFIAGVMYNASFIWDSARLFKYKHQDSIPADVREIIKDVDFYIYSLNDISYKKDVIDIMEKQMVTGSVVHYK